MKGQKGSQCVLHGLRVRQRKNEKYRSEGRGMGLQGMVYCRESGVFMRLAEEGKSESTEKLRHG